jgi:predicted HicB family RNase H-like nuclease
MIGTNVSISKETQKLLIKAAAARKVSVEKLASEILIDILPPLDAWAF